ncbi:hypothetical protein EsDP_00005873 [Epichloe bromicola]|uniref:Uncharacterized protein n=1 Tax=Epichloe bromicola TaxID=79588 RepID=A0ABQ0CW16_9HYPO
MALRLMDTKAMDKHSSREASSHSELEDASGEKLRKVLINYANITGISRSLKFGDGNDFSRMATSFFIGYAVAEFPLRIPHSRIFLVIQMLGINVILWGIVICCMTATQNFPGVTAVRTDYTAGNSRNGKKVFQLRAILEAAPNLQVWLLCLNTDLIVISSGIITTVSATLVAGFGYKPKTAALLNTSSGVASRLSHAPGNVCDPAQIPPVARHHPASDANLARARNHVVLLQVASSSPSLAGIYLINLDKEDAPRYLAVKITVFGICGGAVIVTTLLRVLHGWRQRQT